MPFKSKAQRRKFYAMLERGEIDESTVREWEKATPKGKKLPERVKKSWLSELTKVCEELEGGLGDSTSEKDVDDKELARGIEVEKEHTGDPEIAKEIALDHLAEHSKYYTALDKMEKELEEGENEKEAADKYASPKFVQRLLERLGDVDIKGDILGPVGRYSGATTSAPLAALTTGGTGALLGLGLASAAAPIMHLTQTRQIPDAERDSEYRRMRGRMRLLGALAGSTAGLPFLLHAMQNKSRGRGFFSPILTAPKRR